MTTTFINYFRDPRIHCDDPSPTAMTPQLDADRHASNLQRRPSHIRQRPFNRLDDPRSYGSDPFRYSYIKHCYIFSFKYLYHVSVWLIVVVFY